MDRLRMKLVPALSVCSWMIFFAVAFSSGCFKSKFFCLTPFPSMGRDGFDSDSRAWGGNVIKRFNFPCGELTLSSCSLCRRWLGMKGQTAGSHCCFSTPSLWHTERRENMQMTSCCSTPADPVPSSSSQSGPRYGVKETCVSSCFVLMLTGCYWPSLLMRF